MLELELSYLYIQRVLYETYTNALGKSNNITI